MSVACERCGTSFHVKPSRMRRYNTRFCSRACRAVSNDPAHFWARIDIRGPDECWPWKAGKRMSAEGRNYGVAFFEGRHEQAHRVAFRLTHGYWPSNGRHSCDNPPCCNPAHILDGTHADNMNDKVARGRTRGGRQHHG
jgi:HNH endonuclease